MAKNVIVGQSGGPTAVINSSLAGVYKTAKDLGAEHVYGMRYGIQGLLNRNIVDMDELMGNDLEVELLKRTPSSYLGSCRFKLPEISAGRETFEKVFEILKEYKIDVFCYIGGNDSMDTIKKLSDYAAEIGSDICFMGVPKTVDNDLAMTDHTPGFGSAAKYIATTTKELIRDGLVYDLDNVFIIEIMGRNAGWLAGAAALAKGPDCEGVDLLYLPEVPFDVDDFLKRTKALIDKKRNVVVAISEGIKTADGTYVAELANANVKEDAFGHKQMGGAGSYLASLVSGTFGCKSRAVEFSTIQRCASHIASAVDVAEAFNVGGAAVKAGFEGNTGKMILITRESDKPYISGTSIYDIHQIANVEKTVPLEWIVDGGTNVSDEFINYVRPLIQNEVTPVMLNGAPMHAIVK